MMTGDRKSQNVSTSKVDTLHSQTHGSASTSDRKLSIELPLYRQIYTIGSTVTGLVHLGTKDRGAIQEVHVSLVCVVRTMHHRYMGGTTHDVRRETTKLLHLNETLWSRAEGDTSDLPADYSFQFIIPDFGNDDRATNPQAPLPPSFHAGKRTGWGNMITYAMPVGSIRYHIKVSVVRKGHFKRKERAFCPIVFLPPSPPPPLLPTLPDSISVQNLDGLNDGRWSREMESSNLHTGVFSSSGKAILALWLPQVPSLPRLMRIPFILRLALQTRRVEDASGEEPPKAVVPPPAQLDKASMYLSRSIRAHTRGATQTHTKVIDENAADNFLHGITPEEGPWVPKNTDGESYWDKGYMWRGFWTFKEVPNFSNRQLTWEYTLVAEIPVKGMGNSAKLVSHALEVNSGVTAGTNVMLSSEADLPPDYFDIEGMDTDDDDDSKDIKA